MGYFNRLMTFNRAFGDKLDVDDSWRVNSEQMSRGQRGSAEGENRGCPKRRDAVSQLRVVKQWTCRGYFGCFSVIGVYTLKQGTVVSEGAQCGSQRAMVILVNHQLMMVVIRSQGA